VASSVLSNLIEDLGLPRRVAPPNDVALIETCWPVRAEAYCVPGVGTGVPVAGCVADATDANPSTNTTTRSVPSRQRERVVTRHRVADIPFLPMRACRPGNR
jgi:hypothetical protein